MALVTMGTRNAFGVFILPMEEEFGWNRTTVSIAGGLGVLCNGVLQPFMGRLFDRYGRVSIIVSLVTVSFATMALSLTMNIIYMAFMFGVVASAALGGTSLTNTGALLSRWFRRKRATVIGLNASGASFGALLIMLWSVPLVWKFLKTDPADMGLQPDGDPVQEASTDSNPTPTSRNTGPLDTDQWTQPFRSPPFWQMSMAYVVCGTTTFVLSFHFVAFAQEDRNLSAGMAATIFAVMGGLNAVGTIGAGVLSDRFTRNNLLTAVYFTRGIAYLVLLIPPLLNIPVLEGTLGVWVFACMAGLSWLATAPLTSSLTADVYGLRALGTISGVSFMFHQFGGFTMVIIAGILRDITGSYTVPFLLAGSLLFPAAITAFSIQERRYSARYQTQAAVAAAGDG